MKSQKERFRSIWLLLLGFGLWAGVVFILCLTADRHLPDNIARRLTEQEMREVADRNSPLIDYVYLSPNANFPRKAPVCKVTVHHMADELTLDELGDVFAQRDRRASANYAIDTKGRVALYVEEDNRAWTSSNRENDDQAVTIEVANDRIGGDWHVSDEAYAKLVELCTDICRRNGIESLEFTGDSSGSLTIHKMFADTECPGPYLESRMEELAAEVTRQLKETENQ